MSPIMAKMDFMTSSPSNSSRRRRRIAGFTLVELMIATGLGSVILAGVLSTFLMLVPFRVLNFLPV